jgi:hypothetical protein
MCVYVFFKSNFFRIVQILTMHGQADGIGDAELEHRGYLTKKVFIFIILILLMLLLLLLFLLLLKHVLLLNLFVCNKIGTTAICIVEITSFVLVRQ